MHIIGYILIVVGALAFLRYMGGRPFDDPAYRSPVAGAGCALLPVAAGAILLWFA
jgi:hypothetical protein